METIKTASMVIVLMAVGYGVYTVLNQPEQAPPGLPTEADSQLSIEIPEFSSSPGTQLPTIEPIASNLAPPYASSAESNITGLESAEGAPAFNSLPNEEEAAIAPNYANNTVVTPSFDEAVANNPAMNPTPANSGHLSSESTDNTELASSNSPASVNEMFNPQGVSRQFDLDWRTAGTLLEANEYAKALRSLSPWRNRPELNTEQNEKLNRLLGQLAGTVVYSTEHLMLPPHTVGRDETLETIANKYQISSVLLQKINGIANPQLMTPGQRLKVLQGPFAAKVDLLHSEIVLSVDGCYAGRFPLSLSASNEVKEGDFKVSRKEENPNFFDPVAGNVLTTNDPGNPYGKFGIYLNGGFWIHGSTQASQGGDISLSPRDIEDVFGILTVGSQVQVLR